MTVQSFRNPLNQSLRSSLFIISSVRGKDKNSLKCNAGLMTSSLLLLLSNSSFKALRRQKPISILYYNYTTYICMTKVIWLFFDNFGNLLTQLLAWLTFVTFFLKCLITFIFKNLFPYSIKYRLPYILITNIYFMAENFWYSSVFS